MSLLEHENSAVPPPAPAAPDDPPNRSGFSVFQDADGLRAGWRLLLYVTLAVGFFLGLRILLAPFWKAPPDTFSNQFLTEVIGFTSAFSAAVLMSFLERRPVGAYGLAADSAFGKLFWQGSLAGLLEISIVVGLMSAFGGYSFGRLALHGAELLRWAVLWAVCLLFVALFEEFLFRGYTLYTLSSGIGFWPAAILLSLLFGAVHLQNSGEGWIGVAGVFVVGLLWCFTVKRTGSLWFAVGMHAAFDFGETFLYSVPDSGIIFPGHLSDATIHGSAWLTGGTVGPEASVFDFVMLFLMFYVVHRLYPAGPPTHQEHAALQRTSSEANTNLTP